MILFVVLVTLLCLDLIAIAILNSVADGIRNRVIYAKNRTAGALGSKGEKNLSRVTDVSFRMEEYPIITRQLNLASSEVMAGPAVFGKAHHIGSRTSQQDSFGKAEVFGGQGVLAVVADGMGGLSGGDQVSQQIVMAMLSMAAHLNNAKIDLRMDGILPQLVRHVNQQINRMLGPGRLYKSGSTLLAVLSDATQFHWIAVGDSRIYLYRQENLIQINQEHTQLQEWMPEILNGTRSYEESMKDPKGRQLTSFIGMGQLKYVDFSLRSIRIVPGDRILLMTDGVFNTISEQKIASILTDYPQVQQAAEEMEKAVLQANAPGQDNFTVVILGY